MVGPAHKRLTPADIDDVAAAYDIEPAVLWAVAEVESGPYGGFLASGEPVILYEPHVFHRLTAGKFAKDHPDLSYRHWGERPYGRVTEQHAKLQRAVELDRFNALQSCSWGLFQVMGCNWGTCGFDSLQEFVNAAYRSERDHLGMMLGFCERRGLLDDLRARQWSAFARGYNGPGFAQHGYHTRLREAYEAHREYANSPNSDFNQWRA